MRTLGGREPARLEFLGQREGENVLMLQLYCSIKMGGAGLYWQGTESSVVTKEFYLHGRNLLVALGKSNRLSRQ